MPRAYGVTNAAPYASAPAVGAAGDTYFNTTDGKLYLSNGSAWSALVPGVDEVWIGTSDPGGTYDIWYNPTDPTPAVALPDVLTAAQIDALSGVNLWTGKVVYQTDYLVTGTHNNPGLYTYNGVAWRRPWNDPWGLAAIKSSTTMSQTGITTTVTDLTGVDSMTLTFTAVANRYYQITFQCSVNSTVANDRVSLILRDGTSTQLLAATNFAALASANYTIGDFLTTTFAAGSQTLKLSGVRNTGTGTLSYACAATGPAQIVVNDIGPVPGSTPS